MGTNNQLQLRASDIVEKAKADYELRLEPVTQLMETFFSPDEELSEANKLVPEAIWYRSLCYKTQTSWSRSRRVVTKGALWMSRLTNASCCYLFTCFKNTTIFTVY